MNHLRRFPRLCFVLAILAIAGFCLVTGATELLVVAGVLAVISWFITEGPRGRTVPRWVSNVLVLGLLVNMLLEAQASPGELPAVLGRFTVFLTIVKLYERRTARDHAQLMGLSLLLMLIGAARMPPPLFFGLLLLVYLALGLYCVLLYQLYAAHERMLADRRRIDVVGLAASRPPIGRRTGLHLRMLAAGTGTAVAAVGLVIFLLFPRELGRGMFAPPAVASASGGGVTGLSPSVDLQTGTRISTSPQVVAEVRTVPPPGESDPIAAGGVMRLRAFSLDRYDGNGRWSRGTVGSIRIETRPGSEVGLVPVDVPPPDPAPRLWRQSFRFMRDTGDILHLGGPVRVRIDEGRQSLAFDQDARRLRAVGEGGGSGRIRRYELWSVPEPGPGLVRALTGGGTDALVIGGVLGQRFHPATRAIRREAVAVLRRADAWDSGAGRSGRPRSILAAADAFAAHLTGGGFRYTLDLSDVRGSADAPGGGDPVARFLLETRRGHCEYFASAFVALCQSVGIPARLVIGYVAAEPGAEPGIALVRASDAHAWAEVRTGPWSWRTYDPTPPGVITTRAAESPTLGGRVGRLYEQFEGTWNDRFVGFDSGLQAEIFGALGRGREATIGSALLRIREWAADVNRAFHFGPAGYVWLGIVGFAGAIAVVAFVRWIARRRRIRRGLRLTRVAGRHTEQSIRRLAFYFDMLEIMARRGLAKPRWQPPLAWAASLARRRPDLAEDVRVIGEAYYAGRYGGQLPDGERLAEIRDRLGRLAEATATRR
ncbi:MAG: transglutaminase TgpA family protein, partial [Planctomycetota bacterium]